MFGAKKLVFLFGERRANVRQKLENLPGEMHAHTMNSNLCYRTSVCGTLMARCLLE
jgi:hypothetical protein